MVKKQEKKNSIRIYQIRISIDGIELLEQNHSIHFHLINIFLTGRTLKELNEKKEIESEKVNPYNKKTTTK